MLKKTNWLRASLFLFLQVHTGEPSSQRCHLENDNWGKTASLWVRTMGTITVIVLSEAISKKILMFGFQIGHLCVV